MKYLTFELIKAQLRLDDAQAEAEQALLVMYGEAAEETVLNILARSYEDVLETYGKMPTTLVQASLMLVDVSYQHRSPVSAQNMSIVPYTFDLLIKPYMRLSETNANQNNSIQYGCKNL